MFKKNYKPQKSFLGFLGFLFVVQFNTDYILFRIFVVFFKFWRCVIHSSTTMWREKLDYRIFCLGLTICVLSSLYTKT